ncbi:MAG: HK97 family phage prohead protease [Methanobrevibacter sp.]|nr:HK97 family phage prohead protease [Methanobrevibacter sp.]MBQ9024872.1 HK97 family phage prohead protease [Methanobrevibacter sp.]
MSTEVLEKQFQLYARPQIYPETTKSYTLNEDGSLTIEGIASTTNKDLQLDIVTPTCIESMKRQLQAGLNLHGDHWYGLFDGVIGAITHVVDTDAYSLRIKATILPKYAQDIKEMLDIGVKLGLSIGGRVTEHTQLEDGGWEIKDITLREISLTSMPANWDTYGTITTSKGLVKSTCLTGACYTIMKNEVQNMTQKNNEEVETLTKQDVIDLINENSVSLKEELLNDTVQAVSKQLEKIVKDAIKSASEEDDEDEGEGKPAETNEEEEEEEEEKSLTLEDIKGLFHTELESVKSEIKSISETDVTETVKDTVDKAVSEQMDKLFKDLNKNRQPDFQYNEEEIDKNDEDNDAEKTEFTSREAAEMLVAKQTKEDFLKSLL